jgi:DUF1680 family protein
MAIFRGVATMAQSTRKLHPVDCFRVTLNDGFWAPRVRINREVTIGAQYTHLKSTGRIDGIDPGYKPGDRKAHHIFWDSDVAKWMEGASYCLMTHRDQELEKQLDEVIEKFARLQRDDGYLNSWFTAVEPEKRWANLRDCHELYCAGHLMEAGVAYYQATGKRRLLDVACRYADYIDTAFGREEGKRRGYCGHEEIELALVKLYRATGNEQYLNLATYFIDERGRQPYYYDIEAEERGEDPRAWHFKRYEYCQAHLPVREQTEVVGHAVRATYLYSGMTDVAQETGDETLITALNSLWEDVCLKKMYVTGGIGPSSHNEGFTAGYDLPEESAYCETCAAVGLVLWNHRMLHIGGDGRFADVMERALYNGTISGVSLSGDRFFYVNPLASVGHHHRQEWFGCACCPGNISRLIAHIGQYIYSEGPRSAWIHLYARSSAELHMGEQTVRLEQKTDYPWDGEVAITILLNQPTTFTLNLRLPEWCQNAALRVNGKVIDTEPLIEKGYMKVSREWKNGDTVLLNLDMPVERIVAHPAVRMANGKVALQRGPIVYCLEGVDNPVTPLNRIALPRTALLDTTYRNDLLNGVVVITAPAEVIEENGWDGVLYRNRPATTKACEITAVPYCVWDNREPGQMLVWIREG